jgi:CBS domain-containing protein
MKVKDFMKKEPLFCFADDSVITAASLMKHADIGVIPIVADRLTRKLVGVVTDRDLCCTVIANGLNPALLRVGDFMTKRLFTCQPEHSIDTCLQVMEIHSVRRVPVIDDDGKLVGIISLADIALHARPDQVYRTLAAVSKCARTATKAGSGKAVQEAEMAKTA